MIRSVNGCVRNIFHGFMKCMKLPNKEIYDICNNKKKCFRQCAKFIACFENHNKEYINSCPYCKYNVTEHNKINKMIDDMFCDGIEM